MTMTMTMSHHQWGGRYESSNGEDEYYNKPENEPEVPDSEINQLEFITPSVQWVRGLRPRKPREYGHRLVNIVHHTITQYSLKRGLKKFKEKGEAAVSNDRMQLHMKYTFTPQDATKLSMEQTSNALESLMFVKEKGMAPSRAAYTSMEGSNEMCLSHQPLTRLREEM
jgi:hypothetical protein